MEAITRYITEKLNEHPDEMSRQYEVGLTKMITASNTPLNIDDVLGLIDDPNSPDDLRYACFVMATIWYRHMKDMENVENLIRRYQDQFSPHHPSFTHYRLLAYVDSGYRENWRDILKQAEDNARRMNNSGAQHMFAEFTAMFFESDHMDASAQERKMWLDKGITQVNRALSENAGYAKFYSTKGRLFCLKELYDEADHYVNLAIEKEDSSRKDYAIRIGNYQAVLMRIQQQKNIQELRRELEHHQSAQQEMFEQIKDKADEINGSLMRNLEYLGIFAGIISFTIGSLSLANGASKYSLIGAGALILILFGALVGTYGLFDIIIHGYKRKERKKYGIVLICTLLLILGGFLICWNI